MLDELLDNVTVHPDRLVVTVHGAPPRNVAFSEVGPKDSELSRVGGGTSRSLPGRCPIGWLRHDGTPRVGCETESTRAARQCLRPADGSPL